MKPEVREQLISDYADECVNSMDMDTLCTFAKDTIEDNLRQFGDNIVLKTITEYYPHLLDGVDIS